MYLAEDRILCFEIVTKKREGWMFVPSSNFCDQLDIDSPQLEVRQECQGVD
jgi:cellulose synthase/poly-beta-1,6-N-acetylglucosamine synthase-like glycosyltransferase